MTAGEAPRGLVLPARLFGDHDEESTFAAACYDLLRLHFEVVPGGPRARRLKQIPWLSAAISGKVRHTIDELQPRLIKPAQDLAKRVNGFVRMLVLIRKPGPFLVFAHGHGSKVGIDPLAGATRNP